MQTQTLEKIETLYKNNIIMYDKKLITNVADKIIEEIDEHIDNTIHWQLDPSEFQLNEFDDLYELELQIKQQVLFSLIKRITK